MDYGPTSRQHETMLKSMSTRLSSFSKLDPFVVLFFFVLNYSAYRGFQHFYCTFLSPEGSSCILTVSILHCQYAPIKNYAYMAPIGITTVLSVSECSNSVCSRVLCHLTSPEQQYPDDQCFAAGSSSTSELRFLFSSGFPATALFPGPQCFGFS